jgi:hypothetical protein
LARAFAGFASFPLTGWTLLGTAIGDPEFVCSHVSRALDKGMAKCRALCRLDRDPHAAYALLRYCASFGLLCFFARTCCPNASVFDAFDACHAFPINAVEGIAEIQFDHDVVDDPPAQPRGGLRSSPMDEGLRASCYCYAKLVMCKEELLRIFPYGTTEEFSCETSQGVSRRDRPDSTPFLRRAPKLAPYTYRRIVGGTSPRLLCVAPLPPADPQC